MCVTGGAQTRDTQGGMSRKKPAVLGDEKTTEARTSQPGVVSAYAHSGMRGWRHNMEDSVVAEQIAPALSCFAVFDGHGGDHCARWAARELPRRCRALLTAAGSLPGMHATTVDR